MEYNLDPAKENLEELVDDLGVEKTGKANVTNPKKWFADSPNLYRVVLQLKDSSGKVIETAVQRIGFRKLKMLLSMMLVNNKCKLMVKRLCSVEQIAMKLL